MGARVVLVGEVEVPDNEREHSKEDEVGVDGGFHI